MRLGCCADISKAEVIKEAGFDYIECTVLSLIPQESDEVFQKTVLNSFEESTIPVESFNVLLPRDLPVVGNSVNWESVRNYINTAFDRVKQVGGQTVVFGSGGARNIPEGFDRREGEEQIIKFLNLLADKAEEVGITVVIEPLNKKECNILNSVSEAVKFADKVNRPSIQVLADFYHMDEEKEPLENMARAGDLLKHVHVADSGRLAPGTGEYPYQQFVKILKDSGYHGRVSIECKWDDFDHEIIQAQQFLQQVFSIK